MQKNELFFDCADDFDSLIRKIQSRVKETFFPLYFFCPPNDLMKETTNMQHCAERKGKTLKDFVETIPHLRSVQNRKGNKTTKNVL